MFLLLSLTCQGAQAQPRGGQDAVPDLLLDLLLVARPLVPLLAGAGLFKLTRSHLVAAGLPALGCGAWGAWTFDRLSDDDPLSGALIGLGLSGIPGGLLALAGSGYVHLIGAAARRLGTQRTAILHTVWFTRPVLPRRDLENRAIRIPSGSSTLQPATIIRACQ